MQSSSYGRSRDELRPARQAFPVNILAMTACLAIAPAAAAFDFFQPVDPPRVVQVMAHRGAARRAPENSRAAIERCVEDGFEWAEVDVRRSSDGRHVIFHDSTLDAKSNGRGEVSAMPAEEFLKLDIGTKFAKRFAGTPPLSLEQCLEIAKGKINLCLDCKDADPEALAREVLAAGMERQVVIFDGMENLLKARLASEGKVAIMPKWRPELGLEDWIAEAKPDAVEIDADVLAPEIAAAFHGKGIKVQAKVLGERDAPEFWAKAIHAGADWLQTDLPEEIVAAQASRHASRRPALMCLHRGASRYAPENTLPAFEKALRLRADYVEFDVRPSSDGKYFLLHDAKLDRTTTGKGFIKAVPGAEIEKLDAGAWFGAPFAGTKVAALDDFFEAFKGKAGFYFDAKDIAPEELAEALARHEVVEEAVVYGGETLLAKLKEINPRIRVMPGLDDPAELDPAAARLKPFAFDVKWDILSEELIARCHAAGALVFSDSVGRHDNAADMLQAMEQGIDLIQTDQPMRFWRAVEMFEAKEKNTDEEAEKPNEPENEPDKE